MNGASIGRLTARPSSPAGVSTPRPAWTPGVHALGLGGRRDGLLAVPPGAAGGTQLPLVLALHGAGGNGQQMTALLEAAAAARGVLVLAPDSRGVTWDVIR